jgi:hypothetical protein
MIMVATATRIAMIRILVLRTAGGAAGADAAGGAAEVGGRCAVSAAGDAAEAAGGTAGGAGA